MVLDGLAEGAENNALFGEILLKRRLHRDTIHHRIDRHAAEDLLLLEGDAELVESLEELGIDLAQVLRPLFFLLRGSIIDNILVIDGRDVEMSPGRHFERLPVAKGAEAEVEQPFRLVFLGGNEADGLFVEAAMYRFRIYMGNEAVFILAGRYFVQYFV